MRRLRNRFGLGALLALILGATLALIAPPPAGATGPLATVRQLAGTIPIPYDEPRGVVPVGGVLFVTDRNAIDRVDGTASTLTILAGVRTVTGSSDGAAGAARFNDLQGIATDGTNLYVADSGNHTIRRVVIATGAVTTVAGTAGVPGSTDGTGAAALFNQPYGLSLAGGDLWVTDRGNQTIRRLTLATGAVTTVAGSAGMSGTADGTGSAARFSDLRGIAVGGTTVWISDHDRIRRLDAGTAVVTSVATASSCPAFWAVRLYGAVATGGFAYFGQLCDDGDGDLIANLLRLDTATEVVDAVGTATVADGLGTDGTTLYSAGHTGDFGSRSLVAAAIATVMANGFTKVGNFGDQGTADGAATDARFGGGSIASDGGSLFIVSGASIRKVSIATGQTTTLATGVGGNGVVLYGPWLFTGSGRTLLRIDRYTGASTAFATVGGTSSGINGIASNGGDLFVATRDCAIYRVDPSTAAVSLFAGFPTVCDSTDGTGPNARFGLHNAGGTGPTDLTADGTTLWVSDWEKVRKIDIATAQVTTLIATNPPFYLIPRGIAESGPDLYVASSGTLLRISKATAAVTQLDASDPSTPLGYAPTPLSSTYSWAGDVYVDHNGSRIFFTHSSGVGVAEDPPTALSIGDSTVVEGNAGTGLAVFTVRLARSMRNDVRVTWLTNDGTATAASGDYVGQSGSLTIPAGDTEGRIKVTVNGDTTAEPNEGFKVRLVSPQGGATLTRFLGQGTILNDDPPGAPSLAIGDVGVVEGDEGTSLAVFPVRLSSAQGSSVTVAFATADGSAVAGSDYEARAGTLTFPAGVTSATIFVKVYGDTAVEGNESFTLVLSGSTGPPISRTTGTGTIVNDDA